MRLCIKSSDGFGSLKLEATLGTGFKNECIINTHRFCLLCIGKIVFDECAPPPPPHSMVWAEHHLQIHFLDVLIQNQNIIPTTAQPFLLKCNEKGVEFKATICNGCASIIEALSVESGPSGEIENEQDVLTVLNEIRNKMEKVDESERMAEFYKVTGVNSGKVPKPILLTSIGRKLRTEIMGSLKVYLNSEQQRGMSTSEDQPGMRDEETIQGDELVVGRRGASRKSQGKCMEEDSLQLQDEDETQSETTNVTSDHETETHPIPPTPRVVLTRSARRPAHVNPSPVDELPHRDKSTPKRTIPSPKNKIRIQKGKKAYHSKYSSIKNDSNNFECIFCQKEFSRYDKLEAHMRQHTHESHFFCTRCEDTFTTNRTLQDHIAQMHNPKRVRSFQCDLCPKKFFRMHELRRHRLIHNEDRPFRCGSCPLTFKTNGNLLEHITWAHTRSNIPLKCDVCKGSFINQRQLKVHQWQAHKSNYFCEMCGKQFRSKANLHTHAKSHVANQEKPFKCPYCGLRFFDKSELGKHTQRCHPTKTVWTLQCEICELRFKTNKYLMAHLKRHRTGKRLLNTYAE